MGFGSNTVAQHHVNTTLKYNNDCHVSSAPFPSSPAFYDDADNNTENHSPISFKPPGEKRKFNFSHRFKIKKIN